MRPSGSGEVCNSGRRFRRQPPAVRRRDRRRAEGDARHSEGALHPGTSACGHFAGMPTRSLHARRAGAPGDTAGARSWQCRVALTRFAPAARPTAAGVEGKKIRPHNWPVHTNIEVRNERHFIGLLARAPCRKPKISIGASPVVMYFAGTPHTGPVPSEESLRVLDEYFAWRRSPEGAAVKP